VTGGELSVLAVSEFAILILHRILIPDRVCENLFVQAAAALCYGMFAHTTLSFSNMIGPTEQVLFCGNPILYIAPGTYGHPHVKFFPCSISSVPSVVVLYDSTALFLPVWLSVRDWI